MGSTYLGCALCEVDTDGNVLVTDETAQALGLPALNQPIFFSAHERDHCLVGYARSDLNTVQTRTARWQLSDETDQSDAVTADPRLHRLLGMVEAEPRSAHGLRLPASMRQMGQIESVALIVGAGDRFEIWNPNFVAPTAPRGAAAHGVRPVTWRHQPRAGSRRERPARF